MQLNTVYNQDFLTNSMPDKSVQLIIADPPYFEVKGDFDFIWKSFDDYLVDVEKWAIECKRVLADNGTLFWWGHAKKIAYSQVILDKYFNLENSLVWRKIDSMQYQYYSPNLARSFNTHNERLLMYSKPLNPFSIYLKSEFKAAKITNKEISKLFPSASGGLTGCVSNWLNGDNVITKEQYLKIKKYLNGEYLRKEYEDLRRFFYNPNKFEEVLQFSQEAHITKEYDHDTKKPETLTRALILTCSRPNDLVLAPFAGSGTECAMAAKEDRNFIGFEITERHAVMAQNRANKFINNPTLF